MLSRRTMVKAGITTFASLASVNQIATLAQSGTPDASVVEIENLLHHNLPELPEATAGEIEVVLTGYDDGTRPALLIHNATDKTIGVREVTGIATLDDGTQLETLGYATIAPDELPPGGYAMGVSRLEDSIPADAEAEFEFEFITYEPDGGSMPNVEIPVIEIEVETDSDSIVGRVENTRDVAISELAAVVGLFFGPDGEIVGWFYSYLAGDVDPGETGRFTRREFYGEITDSYAFAASGPAG